MFISFSYLKISLYFSYRSFLSFFNEFKFSSSWANFKLRVSNSDFNLSNFSLSSLVFEISSSSLSKSSLWTFMFSDSSKCSCLVFLSSKLSSTSGRILSSNTAFLVSYSLLISGSFLYAFSSWSSFNNSPISLLRSAGPLSIKSAISPCIMWIAFRNVDLSIEVIAWISSFTEVSPEAIISSWPLSIRNKLEPDLEEDLVRVRDLSTLYSLAFWMKLSLTDISIFSFISLLVLIKLSFLVFDTLNNANEIASNIVDFPAPFSPTIKLMPGLKSNTVWAWDLKLFNSSFVNIIHITH